MTRTLFAAALLLTFALALNSCSSDGAVGSSPSEQSAAPDAVSAFDLIAQLGDDGDYDEWVILERDPAQGLARAEDAPGAAGAAGPEWPGCGSLMTLVGGRPEPLVLESTDVHIGVLGPVATASVRQRFTNPYTVPIEASYVFPLPQDAAVHDFVLTVGERRIRGLVREREEARRIYERARALGHTAALLTQTRPNVFTQEVANIAPGHAIDVELAYLEPVDFVDGWQEIAFPMIVGPRYFPVGMARSREARTLGAGRRSGHDVTLAVELDAGLDVERIESPSHGVTIDERPGGATVRLSRAESIPNADFRLRWQVAGDGLRTSLVREGDFALLTLYPPNDLASLPRRPMEHVFVLDTSGSMRGEPIAAMKRAMRAALRRLEPCDTFRLVGFSSQTGALSRRPQAATSAVLKSAHRWVDKLRAEGGTEMLPALREAISSPSDGERPRVITFMTDGLIGNEDEILGEIEGSQADVRVFAFGIGASPNRWLLSEMAKRSGGAAAYIGVDDDPVAPLTAYFDRTSRPALARLALQWRGARAVAAGAIPSDILLGRPVTIPFALEDAGSRVGVTIRGQVAGALRETSCEASSAAPSDARGALGKVWARERLAELAKDARRASGRRRGELADEMTRLALRHGIVSSFTSFLAVDSWLNEQPAAARGGADGPARVEVGVPVPVGQVYESRGD